MTNMATDVREGILIDLGSDSMQEDVSDSPLNLRMTFESDISSTRSKVSSILCSSSKRLEDDDDPFGLLTTPSASKRIRKIPEVELGTLIEISDEKTENPQNSCNSVWNLSSISPPFSDRNSLLDKTVESTDWQMLQMEADAVASNMKSTTKASRFDKKLNLRLFSPPMLDDSPLNLMKDISNDMVSPPQKVLNFNFGEDFIRKKLSPEILFADEDEDEEKNSDGIYLDDQLGKVIRKSLEGLKISQATEKENVTKPIKPLDLKIPGKPVATVVPSVKRKPLGPVTSNKNDKKRSVSIRAHGGIPLPPPKKGPKISIPTHAKGSSVLPNKGPFTTPKTSRPTVRRSIAIGPDTPRPGTKFVTPAQPLKPTRRSMIPGIKPPICSSTPLGTTPSQSSIPTTPKSKRSMLSTPKSLIPTPSSLNRKPVSRLPQNVMKTAPKEETRAATFGLRRPPLSFRK